MLYDRFTTDRKGNHNPVWIIWFATLIPDSDFVIKALWVTIFPYKIPPIVHGDFHNIGVLLFASAFLGWYIWKHTKIQFKDATLCIGLGFGIHLLEDALVNGQAYHFYHPFSNQMWYHGYVLKPMNDIILAHMVVASTNVVYIGLLLLALAILIRSYFNGDAWLEKYDFIPSLKLTVNRFENRVIAGIKSIDFTDTLTFYGLKNLEPEEYKLLPVPVAERTGTILPKVYTFSLANIPLSGSNEKYDEDKFD